MTGVRPEADFFLWQITERYDDLLELGAALNGTPLAGWLETPHSYLATTKPSNYTDKKRVRQGRVLPRDAPYLVVYPFVKLRPWSFLSFEERAAAMKQHAEVGGKFVTVTNHTTYSFGIDDQEFMPAFECEEPADFMHLMMTCARRRPRAGPSATHRSSWAVWYRSVVLSTRWTGPRRASRPRSGEPLLVAPHADGRIDGSRQHHEEDHRVALGRSQDHRQQDVDEGDRDRRHERDPPALRPVIRLPTPLAIQAHQEEADGDEKDDPQDRADHGERPLRRQRHDDERHHGHERQSPYKTAAKKGVHGPVMKARTASAPARAVVPANHSSRRGPAAGA